MLGRTHHLQDRVDAFVTATSLPDRVDAFVALVRGTRATATDSGTLDQLLDLLDDPDQRRRFQAAMCLLIADTDATSVFADAGIPTERGLPAELGERVMNHLLPRPRNDRDLGHLIRRLFRRPADAQRLSRMPEQRLIRLAEALYPAGEPAACQRLRVCFAD